MYKEDYKNAGLQMLPVIDNGIKRTVLHIFLHALILIPISTLPFFWDFQEEYILLVHIF